MFINERKQGVIILIPKSDKESLSLTENWCPVTLLNGDYKILALFFLPVALKKHFLWFCDERTSYQY